MNRDILGYVAMSILGTAAIVFMVVGVVKHNFDTSLMGMMIGVYAAIIGTVTSVKSELKKEIKQVKEEIRELRKSPKTN